MLRGAVCQPQLQRRLRQAPVADGCLLRGVRVCDCEGGGQVRFIGPVLAVAQGLNRPVTDVLQGRVNALWCHGKMTGVMTDQCPCAW